MADCVRFPGCGRRRRLRVRGRRAVRFMRMEEWTWWSWAMTVAVLIEALSGYGAGFVAAMVVMAGQACVLMVGERSGTGLGVQLRAGYLLLVAVCALPGMRWMEWVPVAGIVALVVFGGSLLVRVVLGGEERWG